MIKKIKYFFRPEGKGVSIERVFKTVSLNLPEEYQYEYVILPDYLDEARGPLSLIKAFSKVRSFCRNNAGEINHITGDIHYCALFLPYKNTVLTIHDLVSLKTLTGIKRTFIWLFWYYLPMKFVKNITCISQFTADQLIDLFPWAKSKITIIPNPIDNDFKFSNRNFNSNNPTILHIGTRSNKNLDLVIISLSGIMCCLRIIGKLTEAQLTLLNENHIKFSNKEFVSDKQIIIEYENCDIVSFPSKYEGFGMPLLEGQMVGRVVLTSNIAPMKDICGGAAYLVDPNDVDSIRLGFQEIITNEGCRKHILDKSLKNIQNFLPQLVAKQYCQLYDKLLLPTP